MRVNITGNLGYGITAKDVILGLIGKYGTDFGTGYVIEFTGETIEKMTMEERMTLCNMAIEAGARAGLIAPDDTTFEYIKGRDYAPKGEAFDKAVLEWKSLVSDKDAIFDAELNFDLNSIEPQVTWGTNPSMSIGINGIVPDPNSFEDEDKKKIC